MLRQFDGIRPAELVGETRTPLRPKAEQLRRGGGQRGVPAESAGLSSVTVLNIDMRRPAPAPTAEGRETPAEYLTRKGFLSRADVAAISMPEALPEGPLSQAARRG